MNSKKDKKDKLLQQKKLKNYRYKKSKLEEEFFLEDHLTEEELDKLFDML